MNDPRQPQQPLPRPAVAPHAPTPQPHGVPHHGHAPAQQRPVQHAQPHAPAGHHAPTAHAPGHHGQHIHRVQPQPNAGPAMVDPLVASSHSTSGHGTRHEQVPMLADEPIELVAEDDGPAIAGPTTDHSHKRIVAFGPETKNFNEQYKRQPIKSGNGACRVKSFHGKYSDEGLRYLDNAINHWLDDHPEVEVKFVTSTVMTFEGKIREPALVLNVWF